MLDYAQADTAPRRDVADIVLIGTALLLPVLSAVLYLYGRREEMRFIASLPPGKDADDVGGDPNYDLLGASWFLLLPLAALLAFTAWWRGERWWYGVVSLITGAAWVACVYFIERRLI